MAWSVEVSLSLLAVSLSVLWYLSHLWKWRKMYLYSWNVPGPLNLPLIGAAYIFFGNPENILDKIIKIQTQYSSPSKVWLGSRLVYSLSDPHQIEKVLTNPKCMNKDYLYKFIIQVIGTGLLTAPSVKWKRHRRAIMPSLNQKILDSFVEVFTEQAIIFNEMLQQHLNRQIRINEPVAMLMMDIICETAMGLKMNAQKGCNTFAIHLEEIMEIVTLRIFRVWHHLDWTWKLYPLSRKLDNHCKEFHNVTTTVIKKKMEAFKKEKENRSDALVAQIEEGGLKKRLAFLDLILQNTDFEEEELRDEVEVFLIAGTDTSSTTLCCLLEMLGLHQDIQQKVYEEVIDILGEERPVEASDLPKMKFLERVIKETLRLFPVGVFFVREVGEDVDLGNHIIPKGAAAFFAPANIHRDPKYWPDPLKFDPDRFLPEEVAKRHPCSYLAFSYGPRNCIGMRYAMMSLKTIAATMLRKYRVFTRYKSVEEMEMKVKVVLRLKKGHQVYLKPR